jgi:hypothetical protein
MTTSYGSTAWDPWTYPESSGMTSTGAADIVGFDVEATDGSIGKIDEATYDVGGSFAVVDTGPWIFGKKVMLPAGTINRVDTDDRKVYVDRTKAQIKDAPEFDKDTYTGSDYRDRLGSYYQGTYPA